MVPQRKQVNFYADSLAQMERKGGFKCPGEEVGQVGTGETREGNEGWGGGEDEEMLASAQC